MAGGGHREGGVTGLTTGLLPVRRALLSVHDKTGLASLGRALVAHGAELVSTGGTARALREAGLPVVEVADLTGAPEMLDGRVKTLHPAVHGGILARRDRPDHLKALEDRLIPLIDLVVANLYPFEEAVARGLDPAACVEEIDVGGPAMVRAAAKNHAAVAVLTDPADYDDLARCLERHGGTDEPRRRRFAAKAFARTAAYDAAIAGWLAAQAGAAGEEAHFPERLTLGASLRRRLRYGENPHQAGAFYVVADGAAAGGLAAAAAVQGKELSYNNLADADAALALAAEFAEPAIVIVKHANPCGAAVGPDLAAAHTGALACDPVSAFGGIVAANRPLDGAAAEAIARVFTEVVVAPGADEAARAALARRPDLRLLLLDRMPDPRAGGLELRSLAGGGLLAQERDSLGAPDPAALRAATRRAPDARELRDLLLAWLVAKHVRSNAIVLVRDGATVGIGAGQMSRVDAVDAAVRKAAAHAPGGASGAVLASDAFFPFPDGLELAARAGVTAAIQPGGSRRDAEVVAAADRAGIAMVLTGRRHFRH
jgi:phosphoribosylaminoimidazolecarboxamide formyltransferase / IMP cyclohydrolase